MEQGNPSFLQPYDEPGVDVLPWTSDKVKTLSDNHNIISIRRQNIVVNPDLFFNKINCLED